jgi:hypothetical protein
MRMRNVIREPHAWVASCPQLVSSSQSTARPLSAPLLPRAHDRSCEDSRPLARDNMNEHDDVVRTLQAVVECAARAGR